jgi:hypothetical protein
MEIFRVEGDGDDEDEVQLLTLGLLGPELIDVERVLR